MPPPFSRWISGCTGSARRMCLEQHAFPRQHRPCAQARGDCARTASNGTEPELPAVKAVILAGGRGSRLSEETGIRPKPMVEIGAEPILWHIMKIFDAHGIRDFVVCCGYRGYVIKEYFATYFLRASDVTFDLSANNCEYHVGKVEPWRVTLVDTGEGTMTGGRLKRVQDFVGDETFFFTYGDGVADIDLQALLAFHNEQATAVTMTAVKPPGRFGAIALAAEQNQVDQFREKPDGDGAWINGGYFVVEPT